MIRFDSNEYWLKTTWDRYSQLREVPTKIREEFLNQEAMLIDSLGVVVNRGEAHKRIQLLDLACGTGRFSKIVLDLFGTKCIITALDLNQSTLDMAEQVFGDCVKTVCANAYNVGHMYPCEFDVVICMEFFHHVSQLRILLNSIKDSLKPGGVLIGSCFLEEKYKEWDRCKYGYTRSFIRSSANSLTKFFYKWMPSTIQALVREKGFARIEPVNGDCFIEILSKDYVLEFEERNYYLFFRASLQ
ncbi:MAG: class I SAM-dependent methyltransferase [candidate division Zixibacteria bacterium]|nr:class I SAM-dependent methyltransferase [candidate division Zixibacteria bacterium]MDH3938088.1 class I SAM-dependent methyltransferase [candidate division Zixibacteria bacterium]MDH4034932.1 class I SAM-dependent methyltransferase [candidate division Zixibacteria bacterium]